MTSILIGDSHANHYYFGLSESLGDSENILHIGAGGCAPIFDVDMVGPHYRHKVILNCFSRMNDLYRKAINISSVKTVYLAFSYSNIFDSNIEWVDLRGDIDFKSDRLHAMELALGRTINEINSLGKRVVLIEDLPMVENKMFKNCLRKYGVLESECANQLVLGTLPIEYKSLVDYAQDVGAKILRTGGGLNLFPYTTSQRLLYRDSTHLTTDGSIYVIGASLVAQ